MVSSIIDEEIAIDFSNVQVTDEFNATISLTGTIDVQYSSTGVSSIVGGSLTAGAGPTFTTFAFTPLGPNEFGAASAVGAHDALLFAYANQAPTSLDFAAVTINGDGYSIASGDANQITSTVICFAAGTLIRTPLGDVPVEALRIGDTVLTGTGAERPVKWLGHRAFGRDESATPRKHEVVRIGAHAFGQDRPSKDLVVSPGHAICIDLFGEVLIPAAKLVNGATVVRERLDEVVLWHVELDSHDILIANNLPAESYLAMGNRGFFEEAGATLNSFEEGRTKTYADFCRPIAIEGDILAFVRQRLLERAKAMGWTPRRDVELRLVVDDVAHNPVAEGGAAAFLFPAAATDVRLRSSTFQPRLFGANDRRTLGVLLKDLVFSATQGDPRRIDLADTRLRDGVHHVEVDGARRWRWTNGELVLDPSLWDGLSGTICLFVAYGEGAVRGWITPAHDEPEASRFERKPKVYAIR